MSWLASTSDLSQVIAAATSPVVAGIAIFANLRVARYML